MKVQNSQFIQVFAEGIGTEEGYFAKPRGKAAQNIPQMLNNPGCLSHWRDREGEPYPEENGFVHFPTTEIGWNALRSQCKINIIKRKLTFREFFAGKPSIYKGFVNKNSTMNNPAAYAQKLLTLVKHRFGFDETVTIDTPMYSLIEGVN